MATIYHNIEIEVGEEDILSVDLEVNASYGNLGIGSYEYWGFRGNDVQMGWEIDDILWDESKYTPEENKLIKDYINNDNNIDGIYKQLENMD